MEHTGTDLEALLEDWRGGRADGVDLYPVLRQAMYQAARQGIGMVTASDPDPHDVEELDGAAQGQVGRSWQHRGASAVGAAETPRWHAEVDANPQLMGPV